MSGNAGKKSREKLLAKMLLLIRENPGVMPSELNRMLGMKHSANLRSSLIKKSLARKEKTGATVRYYPK